MSERKWASSAKKDNNKYFSIIIIKGWNELDIFYKLDQIIINFPVFIFISNEEIEYSQPIKVCVHEIEYEIIQQGKYHDVYHT